MQIYYFTRSGRSKLIAKQLAKREHLQANLIDDHKNWQGVGNYMKAGIMALTGKTYPIAYKKPDSTEKSVVVFPVWAGRMPPAVKTFVKEVGREKIICIPTSMGGKLKDRDGFLKVIDLAGKEISAPKELL